MKFLVVLRPTETGFAAHAPDMEDWLANGRTREQALKQLRAVIEFHIAHARARGEDPPRPAAEAEHLEVLAPVPTP